MLEYSTLLKPDGDLQSGQERYYGRSLAHIGHSVDGLDVMAVGSVRNNGGGDFVGELWYLALNISAATGVHTLISDAEGGRGRIGTSVAAIDVDGDGTMEVVSGAVLDDDGGEDRGALWILFLRSNGSVRLRQKISDTKGGFSGQLSNGSYFGTAVASFDGLNGQEGYSLAASAYGDGSYRGAVWIMALHPDGTVEWH